ncbi:RNA polymerase sigma factor [Paenibacillus sp. 1011MAR3C5]|uniref:RNA polymerase sigma factor n=1 Tax=Paenibacillus sp. 1011MAR3C5 TaxID=1675787 RepID=UPI000E6B81E0|nr:RNA polymerase sigma factor [Paenibacillus sp. 1011MAR3C5]RJE88762.1 RNA polymerase sigma factor [Paenibacillus sp. 1011MAR3C5]
MRKMMTKDRTERQKPDWESLQTSLYRYCLVLTGSEWDAADLSQTTWNKAIRRLREQGHDNPEAFLLRTAKNSWIDDCRRRAAYKELLDGMVHTYRQDPPMPKKHDSEQAMLALFRHLSPIQRTVFVLREALGYSIAETAEWLETTEGAVKAALYRARQSLEAVREELEAEEAAVRQDSEESEAASRSVEALEEGRVADLVYLLYGEPYWTVHAVQGYHTPFRASHISGHSHSTTSMRMCA